MQPRLLYKDANFIVKKSFSPYQDTLFRDLQLQYICEAMADMDEPTFLFDICKTALLENSADLSTILYRQEILKDCLNNKLLILQLNQLATEGIIGEKDQYYRIFAKYPSSVLSSSVRALEFYVSILKKIRTLVEKNSNHFSSEGFLQLFYMLKTELTDDYFNEILTHLKNLSFPNGIFAGATLGPANKGINYTLRLKTSPKKNWFQKLFTRKDSMFTFYLHERDETGARAFSNLKDMTINTTANVLAQSADHVLAFFSQLKIELGFYIGCLNLFDKLSQKGYSISYPVPVPVNSNTLKFSKLYDIILALKLDVPITSNSLTANEKTLLFITGANQGGKSTFLRSLGVSQIMMQCGMFVGATFFQANICTKIFTHYRKEEDSAMVSGKLDEELLRMDSLLNEFSPYSLFLFNESFASTNERDGSEIARQITQGLIEGTATVIFVTHLYEFPQNFFNKHLKSCLFLEACRDISGNRSFKFEEKPPAGISYGQDLYKNIFSK